MKSLLSYLSFLLFFLSVFFVNPVHAQDASINSSLPGGGLPPPDGCVVREGARIIPCDVDESVYTVAVYFTGVPDDPDGDGKFYFCRFSDQNKCVKEKDFNEAPRQELAGFIGTPKNPVIVCGDGNSALKGQLVNGKTCRTGGEDWFHQGHVYTLGLYSDNSPNSIINYVNFYVSHFYPRVEVGPPRPQDKDALTITLKGVGVGGDKQNNYQVVLRGKQSDFYKAGCMTVKGDDEIGSIKLGPTYNNGTYLIEINEQINEKDDFRDRFNPGTKKCDGGFTYYHILVKVGCKDNDDPGGDCIGDPIKDPKNIENRNEYLGTWEPSPICLEFDNEGRCIAVNTALGAIGVSPETFVADVFRLLLSASGIIATIIFIIAGYRLISSRGNKEMIENSREQIVAAILGILFIVLSFVLLEVIGVDILELPGLGK